MLPNPFDLRGPQFLLFYLALGVFLNLLLRYLISRRERTSEYFVADAGDPYKIACLRGGPQEALRVAIISLIDRGLLKADGDMISVEAGAEQWARRPVEQAVIGFFRQTPSRVRDVFNDDGARAACEAYVFELQAEDLLPDEAVMQGRFGLVSVALLLLLGTAATKIMIALSRGRHNLWFLIILTVIFAVWALRITFHRRTARGDEAVRKLREHFAPLRTGASLIKPGGDTNQAAFLAAVFGLASLSVITFPYVRTLFPQAQTSGGSSGGCGGGGCGGGSCGGGGCGGGCGGCGG